MMNLCVDLRVKLYLALLGAGSRLPGSSPSSRLSSSLSSPQLASPRSRAPPPARTPATAESSSDSVSE